MLYDMEKMSGDQPYISNILRNMIACHNYSIHSIIVGERPNPSKLIPHIGSSYSQREGTADTPTLKKLLLAFVSE
jgi:hypothetical protein